MIRSLCRFISNSVTGEVSPQVIGPAGGAMTGTLTLDQRNQLRKPHPALSNMPVGQCQVRRLHIPVHDTDPR